MLSLISERTFEMAQLIVRKLEHAVVQALKERAARKGRSTEAEHREILREALLKARRGSLKSLLRDIPPAGNDGDFARPRAKGRPVRL